jgi:hypothetical protein
MPDALYPDGFQQFNTGDPINPYLRVEPPAHIDRIVEDRLEPHVRTVAEPAEVTNLLRDEDDLTLRSVDWDLSDLTLFVLTNSYQPTRINNLGQREPGTSQIETFDPFSGEEEVGDVFVAMPGFNDIEVVNGKLRTFSTGSRLGEPCLPIDADTGVYYQLNTEVPNGD